MNLLEIGKKDLEPFEITEWVNLSTSKDKFTALHYASFRGNIELLDLLINYGADQKAKNEFGLNVMHIAA
jgi:palmitoyltransferase